MSSSVAAGSQLREANQRASPKQAGSQPASQRSTSSSPFPYEATNSNRSRRYINKKNTAQRF
jgi:hypothetical protein